MPGENKHKKSIAGYIIGLAFLFAIFISYKKSLDRGKNQASQTVVTDSNKRERPLPYRVITSLDSSQHLIAYEFHSDDSADADYGSICVRYPKFSAIIKNTNPAKDDYKNNCRSIISDIIKTTGTPTLEVNIYDDYQAYQVSESGNTMEFMSISKSEMDSLQKHIVATYYGEIYGDYEEYGENYILSYYPQTNGHYTEQEKYDPKKFYNDASQEKLKKEVRMKLYNQ